MLVKRQGRGYRQLLFVIAWAALTACALLLGGLPFSGSTVSAACAPGVWSAQAAYPIVVDDQAVAVSGGLIYSFGGDSTGGRSANAYKYYPGTNSWTPIASLAAGRSGASAVTDDSGYMYIINGVTGSTIQNFLVAYNPAANNYTTLNPPTIATYEQTAQYVNGKIYRICVYISEVCFLLIV
ncbi:MAG: kelch repeat-containing protein, partial [Chloroflexia bacterium]